MREAFKRECRLCRGWRAGAPGKCVAEGAPPDNEAWPTDSCKGWVANLMVVRWHTSGNRVSAAHITLDGEETLCGHGRSQVFHEVGRAASCPRCKAKAREIGLSIIAEFL
jgi:hypothetical protein